VSTTTAPTTAGGTRAVRVEYINPFIESVSELFSTMLGAKAKRGQVTLAGATDAGPCVMALIGLSGPARGNVALSFPADTVRKIVGQLFGAEPADINEDVTDAVAEMANIVAGGAKARLKNDATPIDLGLPTVVVGNEYTVMNPSQASWIEIPFTTEFGPFALRVTFEFEE
jgi:chemotaxis protein CheX